ncbi:hypothetical protein FOZ63_002477 [Perkinsus olseni]|uniref:Uncharacterized protein n=1 Tax=Perkinsus olseni TaxID=32597 RepID=A0A7J6QA35_PEROL|nr:hypothetical protein FOZ63_002477 [Perkinsus olseni]
MLITVHLEKGVAETVPVDSLQAAVQSSSAELKRVVVDVIVNGKRSRLASTTSEAGCNGTLSRSGDELCHRRSSERDSRRSRKIRDAFVTECYHLNGLQSDIRLRFKDGFRAVVNPAVESQKLNWMVRTAIKCLSLLPVRGRRQLLEIPRGTSLYTVALGSLFDGKLVYYLCRHCIPHNRGAFSGGLAIGLALLLVHCAIVKYSEASFS